jgi:integrase
MKRRRKSEPNRHLYLRDGVWWTRFCKAGRDERKSTECPAAEIATARAIRDKRKAEVSGRAEGVERPRDPLLLGELLAAYVLEESQPFDRDSAAEQPGTKRSWKSDRSSVKRITKHLSANLSAAAIDREMLLGFAAAMERETPLPAPRTRSKTLALLRRVYSWAVEKPKATGITRSPFAGLTREERKRLFRSRKRGYLYEADTLRALYQELPRHLVPFVRFALHTGMRFAEITSLRWGFVNLERKQLTVEARFAKNKKERDVAIGDVARGILEAIRPAEPSPIDAVFLGRRGAPIKRIDDGFTAALLKVWKPSKPSEERPRFHDLRKTGATRVEAVSSHAVAKKFLGHADTDVTDTYIVATLDAVRDAVNRAARSIDGEPLPAGVAEFPGGGQARETRETARQTAQSAVQATNQ